ncbi:T9SS type A sorting domain-containing protein, partial [candidate division WOR-3 bacterium]|nr:T9SS type A sorting domain-containing protein [candidate division WOR-3 bacterium]MBD3365089.1 T9SS type A sorting domain-containing protein [candidate division WOR-3 bacterium]
MFYLLLAIIGFVGEASLEGDLVSFGTKAVDTSSETSSGTLEEIDSVDVADNFIVIWPEYVKNRLNVSLTYSFGEEITVELYNVIGTRVLKTRLSGPRTSIDVSRLDSGVYFVSVIAGDERRTTHRII